MSVVGMVGVVDLVANSVAPVLRRLRHEDWGFEVSLGYY